MFDLNIILRRRTRQNGKKHNNNNIHMMYCTPYHKLSQNEQLNEILSILSEQNFYEQEHSDCILDIFVVIITMNGK